MPRRRSDVVVASAHLAWTLTGVPGYRLAGRWRWALATTTSGELVAKLDGMTNRCLIVDDSTRFLEVAQRVLEGDDVTIVGVATNIGEALDLADQLRPDVVLVDIDLAGESGFELARRLREQRGGAGMQVILISSHDPEDFAEMIAASPVVGFLPKAELSGRAILDLL
jgi:CheY-like chemotaxis protein